MVTAIEFPHLRQRAEIREAVRLMNQAFDLSYWERVDREHTFPEEYYRAFADSGFSGALIPEEYGGGGGTPGDMVAILEEVAMGGGAVNACTTVHMPLLSMPSILAFGTEQQRNEILPAIASGDMYISFGVTEPDAGTDTTKIKTRAKKTGDGWLINGAKVWNSGALRADKVMLLTRTSDRDETSRASGMTLFLVDIDSPGIDKQAIPKIGRNAVASAELFINDLHARDSDIVGEEGRGFYHLLHSLNTERLFVAAECIGLGRWALEQAADYARERVVFDRPIGKNQAVQHPLAKSYLELVSAAQLLYHAVDECESKGAQAVGLLANAAKYLASEAAHNATSAAMKVFGGYSFAREYHIGRYWIESHLPRVAPINNDMILNFVAERALGLERSY